MGAAMTQRPDLARAIHCAVPLLDMVRYHLHLIGKLWTPEYGDPDVAEELEWVLGYSPVSPRRARHLLPGGAVHGRRGRRPRRPEPRPQDDRGAAVGDVVRRRASDPAAPGRSRRPRRRQAAREAGRRARRRAVVLVVAARRVDEGAPTIARARGGRRPRALACRRVHRRSRETRVVVGTVSIRLDDDPDAVPGVAPWSLRAWQPATIDGLPTSSSTDEIPDGVSAPERHRRDRSPRRPHARSRPHDRRARGARARAAAHP